MQTRKTNYIDGQLLEIIETTFHDYPMGTIVKVFHSDWHAYHVVNVTQEIADKRFWWVNENQVKPAPAHHQHPTGKPVTINGESFTAVETATTDEDNGAGVKTRWQIFGEQLDARTETGQSGYLAEWFDGRFPFWKVGNEDREIFAADKIVFGSSGAASDDAPGFIIITTGADVDVIDELFDPSESNATEVTPDDVVDAIRKGGKVGLIPLFPNKKDLN